MGKAAIVLIVALLIALPGNPAPSTSAGNGRATQTPIVHTPTPTRTIVPTTALPINYLPLIRGMQPTPTPTMTPTPTRNPALCAAEYPTVCIPPPPPDLNCGDIEFSNFAVLPPDRHQFDTDRDGIGCEGG